MKSKIDSWRRVIWGFDKPSWVQGNGRGGRMNQQQERPTGAICDGFGEMIELKIAVCPCCGKTGMQASKYYDLSRCRSCGGIFRT